MTTRKIVWQPPVNRITLDWETRVMPAYTMARTGRTSPTGRRLTNLDLQSLHYSATLVDMVRQSQGVALEMMAVRMNEPSDWEGWRRIYGAKKTNKEGQYELCLD